MDKILRYHNYLDGKYLNDRELEECAKKLMGEYCIKKTDALYQIAEIEFYFYSPNHRDIITYPRKCSEKLWFFHQSGVDLTIQSCDEGMNPSFGGILIRSIIKFNMDGKHIETICGPQKCVYELFDLLNAVDNSKEMTPLLKKHNFGRVEVVSTQRYISFNVPTKNLKEGSNEKEKYQNEIKIMLKTKLDNILLENQKCESNAKNKTGKWLIASKDDNNEDSFCDYLKAKYRYYLENVQWEKGYKAANIDNEKNNYKFLLVSI